MATGRGFTGMIWNLQFEICNYFIPFLSLHTWLNDLPFTCGRSLLSPHCFLKNCFSMKFLSFGPPLSILARFSMGFFQKCQTQFSVLVESFWSTDCFLLMSSSL